MFLKYLSSSFLANTFSRLKVLYSTVLYALYSVQYVVVFDRKLLTLYNNIKIYIIITKQS